MNPSLNEALLATLAVPVIAVNSVGTIVYLNQTANALVSEQPTQDVVGLSLGDVLPDLKAILNDISYQQRQTQQNAIQREISINGRMTDVKAVCTTASEGNTWAISLYDISGYKRSENAKNNMIGQVAHDLKQPLAAISSFSDIVEASGELTAKQKQYLDRIRSAANRMAEQVYQLLDLAWIESGMKLTLIEVDFIQLIHAIVDELEPRAATKNIKIALDLPTTIPSMTGDRTRLVQVVTNLLTNAIKYSSENTTITVKTEVKNNGVSLIVSDQGMGIAPEHLLNLFQQFYRVENKQTRRIEGTGLGLYIARSIVEQHNGQISVQSVLDQGSTFTVYLPFHTTPEQ